MKGPQPEKIRFPIFHDFFVLFINIRPHGRKTVKTLLQIVNPFFFISVVLKKHIFFFNL